MRTRLELGGTWEFELDPDNGGIEGAWERRERFRDTIAVPGSWQRQQKLSTSIYIQCTVYTAYSGLRNALDF